MAKKRNHQALQEIPPLPVASEPPVVVSEVVKAEEVLEVKLAEKSCRDCIHWHSTHVDVGECRRNPPFLVDRVLPGVGTSLRFGLTPAHFYCGKYVRKS